MLKLAEECSSSSHANDDVFAIATDLINVVNTPTTPATFAAKPAYAERRITIRELALEKPLPKEVPTSKGTKKVKETSTIPSRDSTPSPIKRARREAKENKLREKAWLQK